jgi:hypothetical protein
MEDLFLGLRRDGPCALALQRAFVFVGEDLDELGEHLLPAFENPFGARALGEIGVL